MKYVWVGADTEYSHTLFKQHPNHKIPQRMAWIAIKFDPENLGAWRAHIIKTKEGRTFPTLQQAKDWAQAVVLLNH